MRILFSILIAMVVAGGMAGTVSEPTFAGSPCNPDVRTC